jgi:hypothetical protein
MAQTVGHGYDNFRRETQAASRTQTDRPRPASASAAKYVLRAPGDASADRAVLRAGARGAAVACRSADSAGASGYRHRLDHDGGAVVAPCWSGTYSPVAPRHNLVNRFSPFG